MSPRRSTRFPWLQRSRPSRGPERRPRVGRRAWSRWRTVYAFVIVACTAAALRLAGSHLPGRVPTGATAADSTFVFYILGGSTALGEPYAPRADIGRIAAIDLGGTSAERASTS